MSRSQYLPKPRLSSSIITKIEVPACPFHYPKVFNLFMLSSFDKKGCILPKPTTFFGISNKIRSKDISFLPTNIRIKDISFLPTNYYSLYWRFVNIFCETSLVKNVCASMTSVVIVYLLIIHFILAKNVFPGYKILVYLSFS